MKNAFLTYILIISIGFFIRCSNEKPPRIEDEIFAIENSLLPAILVKGSQPEQFKLEERMDHYKVPGVSIAIVKDGKIHWAKAYGIANTENGRKVDTNTMFQAGSISKPLAALATLKLVEEKSLDLDVDVNEYLQNWKVPENKFTQDKKVTLRLLLTHSAGITVHGFPGYQQTDTFPSIEEVLNGEGNTPKIYPDTLPGAIWRYSGGGYTIMETVVEDVSGLPLEEYMYQNIFIPFGMEHSTYEQPLPTSFHDNASAAYDNQGDLIEGLWHNYPEQAAAGLWTTPTDLAIYCIEIQESLAGTSNKVFSKETIEMMLTKHKNNWGLGPGLSWGGDSLRFQHGGKNAGFTNSMIAFAYKGAAVIIMTNADNGGDLMNEILNSVSEYYDWGIRKPRVVETVTLSSDALKKLTGQYMLDEQVPGIGDYLVEIIAENNKLVVIDPNNKERDELTPMNSTRFIDLEDGDEVRFKTDSEHIGFVWNNEHTFYKID